MNTTIRSEDELMAISGFSDRLKDAVIRSGGATAVSRSSGVALSTLNDYLKGKEARLSRIAALAKACKVSIDWLVYGVEENLPGEGLSLFGEALQLPANFMVFCVLLSNCQEFHSRVSLTPTLADAFKWIAPNYAGMRTLPDSPIEFKAQGKQA